MATATNAAASSASTAILDLVATEGTAAILYARALAEPRASMRDVADAVHALCLVHGGFPGLVDHALNGAHDAAARAWLNDTAAHVADERVLLARLTAAVGPMPSTPGHAAAEAAILAQRHAIEMLARSDRVGCALGAAIAFVLDWEAIRGVLDACARRVGMAPRARFSGRAEAARAMLSELAVGAGMARAMAFGAQQTLAQHRGLWHLLEARAGARPPL